LERRIAQGLSDGAREVVMLVACVVGHTAILSHVTEEVSETVLDFGMRARPVSEERTASSLTRRARMLGSGSDFLLIAEGHDPAIDVAEHVGMQAVGRRIGVKADVKSGGVKQAKIAACRGEGNHRVGDAVADERPKLPYLGQTKKQAATRR